MHREHRYLKYLRNITKINQYILFDITSFIVCTYLSIGYKILMRTLSKDCEKTVINICIYCKHFHLIYIEFK